MPKKNEVEIKTESKVVNFAVVEITGNQYIVQTDKTYSVKKLDGLKGDKYTCEKVLMVVNGDTVKVGKPYVDGATVEFEIASQTKGEKVDTFKYTAKSRYRKRSGSRALITKLSVKKIVAK